MADGYSFDQVIRGDRLVISPATRFQFQKLPERSPQDQRGPKVAPEPGRRPETPDTVPDREVLPGRDDR